jgi:hypothetical protein
MGNYYPILMQIGTQTNTGMLSSKIAKAELCVHLQDGLRRQCGNSSECYKICNHYSNLMKIGTQTKKLMLSLKMTLH